MTDMSGLFSGVMQSFMPEANGSNADGGDGVVTENKAVTFPEALVEDVAGAEMLRNLLADTEGTEDICATGAVVDVAQGDSCLLFGLDGSDSALGNADPVTGNSDEKDSYNVYDYFSFEPESSEGNEVKSRQSAVTYGGNSNEETMEIDTDMDMDRPLVPMSRQVKRQKRDIPQKGMRSCNSGQIDEQGRDGKAAKKKRKSAKRTRKDSGAALGKIAGRSVDVGSVASAKRLDLYKGGSFSEGILPGVVDPSTLPDEELLLLRPKKTRKKAKFDSPVASRFCHVCSRTPKNVRLAVCKHITDGVCRKVICEKCFDEYKYGNFEHAYTVRDWLCPHCSGICPDRAQCRTYSRINDKLRATRLKQPKLPRKPSSKKVGQQPGATTRLSFGQAPCLSASPSVPQASFALAGAASSFPPVSFTSDHISGFEESFAQASRNFAATTSTAKYVAAEDRKSACGTPVSSTDRGTLPLAINDATLGAFDIKNLPTQEQLQALVMEPDLAEVLAPSPQPDSTAVPASYQASELPIRQHGLGFANPVQTPSLPPSASLCTDAIVNSPVSNEDDLNPAYYPPLLDPLVNEFTNPETW